MLDAVFLGEPGVLEARQRITLRMRAAVARMRSPWRALLTLSAGTAATAAGLALVRRRVGRLASSAVWPPPSSPSAVACATPGSAPRLFIAAGENREQLRNDLAMQTADDVTATLGTMKGVMVKLGQMASYVDEGLAPSVRRTLSRLQDSVPPMSPELAAGVIEEELGQPPSSCSPAGIPSPSLRRRSARCTAPSPGTGWRSRSRCSTRVSPR